MDLVDPANPPSRKPPLVWAIGAAIPWLVLAVAQVVWFVLDGRLAWAHVAAAAVTAVGIAVSQRCDLLVAVAQGEGSAEGIQRAALSLLESNKIRRWLQSAMQAR